ncbi:hypothetical protein NDI56_03115 [Haloarcula sp. S1CR25-12]|uniref:Uncharacterized protein n=1 Tax=Haloarcula saliterrae TaxID=2950534 RepID=A0ABU2F883_9EURY|nr:hypothetical protein [Haloarcula sp. S1CR25-12]MDS0258397.1 hypothetical protein [Haloarcula sp. S1CR25-12]
MPEASHSSLEADVQRAVLFDRVHGLTGRDRTRGRLPVDGDGNSSHRVYASREPGGIADQTQWYRDDDHAERGPLGREFRANVGEPAG